MFESISGILTLHERERLCVEVHGIEWEIAVSAYSSAAFGEVGSHVKVFTWLYHREDALRLFGFSNVQERTLFLSLTKVEGIGPKQALKVLSSISSQALCAALDTGDLCALQRIPGIGKKTAQRMLLALKGTLALTDAASCAQSQTDDRAAHPSNLGCAPHAMEIEDLVTALVQMGYDRKMAAEVIAQESAALCSVGRSLYEEEATVLKRAILALSIAHPHAVAPAAE